MKPVTFATIDVKTETERFDGVACLIKQANAGKGHFKLHKHF